MSEHTKGPWRMIGENTRGLRFSAIGSDTMLAAVYSRAHGDVENERSNAKRIIACVNFCEGQPSDFLEVTTQLGGLTHLIKGVSEVKKHNERLIEMYDKLEEENESLKQRVAKLEAQAQWRPIETAPKDGSPVWVRGNNYGDESKGRHACFGWFDGVDWRSTDFGENGQSQLKYLTHWMPLPNAPEFNS